MRFGLIAMVPNLVPIVIFFGLLGWADVPLSITTAMIASISLGIGVDEAVHLLSEFDHHVRRHGDQQRAMLAAMCSVGPPVIFATLALLLGFLVPTWSSFVPVRQFGALSALGVAPSLLADLLILPALVASTRSATLWDLLRLKPVRHAGSGASHRIDGRIPPSSSASRGSLRPPGNVPTTVHPRDDRPGMDSRTAVA